MGEGCERCQGRCEPAPTGVDLVAELLQGQATCSIETAARCLRIGRSTAYAAARDGSLPTVRLSKRLLVPTAKLRAMLGLGEQAG